MNEKILIAGSRDISPAQSVWITCKIHEVLKDIEDAVIISGCAVGVDKIGERYASFRSWPVISKPADWNKHGKAAGPIRNKEMAEIATSALIFWDGFSPGTRNMIKELNKRNSRCNIFIVETQDD